MVYLKKITIIIILLFTSFLIAEFVLARIIGYPTYGVFKKINGIRRSNNGVSELYFPKSEYWNVEGGNIKQQRNNIGLPGKDIEISDSTKYVYVLGDSYIEAYSVSVSKMATTIFDNNIDSLYQSNKYEVLNLGCSSNNQYDLFLRSKYYEKTYKPYEVILVLTRGLIGEININNKLEIFNDSDDSIYYINNTLMETQRILRNNFTMINLLALYYKKQNNAKLLQEYNDNNFPIYNNETIDELYYGICNTIYNFKSRYKRFKVLAINFNEVTINDLQEFCNKNDICLSAINLMSEENRFKKSGHFNPTGSLKLGNELTRIFIKDHE